MACRSSAASRTVRPSGPDLVERGGEGDDAVARDAAVGGLHARRRRRTRPAAGSSRRCRCRASRGTCRAATAAALPPELPPGVRARSYGLWHGPNALFSLDEPIANSSMLSLPTTTAPARLEPLHDRRVVRRDEALEDPRRAGRLDALREEDVLQRDRDAVEGRAPRALAPRARRPRRRRRARARGVVAKERADARRRSPRCARARPRRASRDEPRPAARRSPASASEREVSCAALTR